MMAITDYLKDWRILIVIVAIALLAVADVLHGLHFGIEFVGGTQIPITLAHPVNPLTMSNITQILDQRITKFGLSQTTVEPVGNSGLYVEIPTTTGADINNTISVIEQQGVFQGIVNGREALNGSGILSGGIQTSYIASSTSVSWYVNFYITQQAVEKFSKAAFGQANKPIYMFIDRPSNSIVLFNQSLLTRQLGTRSTQISEMEGALAFGNQSIPLELMNANASNWPGLYGFFESNRAKFSTVILEKNTPSYIISNLTSLNYSLKFVTPVNMTPQFLATNVSSTPIILDSWPGVGLLSAPTLSPSLTTGNVNGNDAYQIQGAVAVNSTLLAAVNAAQNKSKDIATILSGGALPVQIIVGQPITTPPTLGQHFEVISAIALVLAITAVAVTIVIRYKRLFLIVPIILTTLAELFIIGSIMGLVATIDLSAVAGMIAVIGTGVDAQIIITDEVVAGHKETDMRSRVASAFYLIMRNAFLLSLAMLPLFFSALTTEIWFAGATIIGALLGAAITRPAYGVMVSKRYSVSS